MQLNHNKSHPRNYISGDNKEHIDQAKTIKILW